MAEALGDFTASDEPSSSGSAPRPSVKFITGGAVSSQSGAGAEYDEIAVQPFIWSFLRYMRFYSKIYFRATNQVGSLPHFSGRRQEISRAGFSAAEFDETFIGYGGERFSIGYGRGREIWGTFSDQNLLLAGNSPPYERFILQFKYKRFAYRWFYGSLLSEKDDLSNNINRYLIAKAVEYNNGKNLVMSVGEVTVLSGPDRPVDFSFLNPLALHLEIEQNDRENDEVGNHSNAIVFFNLDWLVNPRWRVAFQFAVDDFQIDAEDRKDKADALGYQFYTSWTPMVNPVGITVFGFAMRMDTYMLQHSYGYANLVNGGKLIGLSLGNDADDFGFGVRFSSNLRLLAELKYGVRRWGGNSLLLNPYSYYDDFHKTPFPSGEVRTNEYLEVKLLSEPIKRLYFGLDGHLDIEKSGPDSRLEQWTFWLTYRFLFDVYPK